MTISINSDGQLIATHRFMLGEVALCGFHGPPDDYKWLIDPTYGPPF